MQPVKLIDLQLVYPILREKLFRSNGLNPPVVPVYYSGAMPDYVAASTRYWPDTGKVRDIRMNNANVTMNHGDPPNTELEQVATLAHEMIHTLFNLRDEAEYDGHGPNFGNVATRIGLTGPLRATVASPSFQRWVKANLKLGDYRTNAEAYPPRYTSIDWLKAVEQAMANDARIQPPRRLGNQPAWLTTLRSDMDKSRANRYSRPTPLVGDMVRWENGDMNEGEEDKLFQHLVDSGLAWSLQGMYGRKAAELAHAGRITIANTHEDMGLSRHCLTTEGLASMLKQAADAHHDYEQGLGHEDADWPTWYAAWLRNMFGDNLTGGGSLSVVEPVTMGLGDRLERMLGDLAARGNTGVQAKAERNAAIAIAKTTGK